MRDLHAHRGIGVQSSRVIAVTVFGAALFLFARNLKRHPPVQASNMGLAIHVNRSNTFRVCGDRRWSIRISFALPSSCSTMCGKQLAPWRKVVLYTFLGSLDVARLVNG